MADRAAVIARMQRARDEIADLVASASHEAWANPAYENGWTAKDLLAHIASTCGSASFLLTMSQVSGGAPGDAAFDGEAFNKQQTEMRATHSPDQILDEIRATMQRDIQSVEAASDEALQKHFVAPWGLEGSVADLIVMSADGQLAIHVADLRRSLGVAA